MLCAFNMSSGNKRRGRRGAEAQRKTKRGFLSASATSAFTTPKHKVPTNHASGTSLGLVGQVTQLPDAILDDRTKTGFSRLNKRSGNKRRGRRGAEKDKKRFSQRLCVSATSAFTTPKHKTPTTHTSGTYLND